MDELLERPKWSSNKPPVEALPIVALGARAAFSTGFCDLGLVLASGSSIRRKMLEDAAVDHVPVRPDVDEAALKAGRTEPAEIASELAR